MPPWRGLYACHKREGIPIFHWGHILDGDWSCLFKLGEQWGTASYLTFLEAEEGSNQEQGTYCLFPQRGISHDTYHTVSITYNH